MQSSPWCWHLFCEKRINAEKRTYIHLHTNQTSKNKNEQNVLVSSFKRNVFRTPFLSEASRPGNSPRGFAPSPPSQRQLAKLSFRVLIFCRIASFSEICRVARASLWCDQSLVILLHLSTYMSCDRCRLESQSVGRPLKAGLFELVVSMASVSNKWWENVCGQDYENATYFLGLSSKLPYCSYIITKRKAKDVKKHKNNEQWQQNTEWPHHNLFDTVDASPGFLPFSMASRTATPPFFPTSAKGEK